MVVLYDECLFGNIDDRVTVYHSSMKGTVLVSDSTKGRDKQCLSMKAFICEYKDIFEPNVLQKITGVDICE